MAAHVGGIIRPTIPPAAREFLDEQPMIVVGSVGGDGRVWASLPTGEPGFVQALDERTVEIDAAPVPGDPLADNLRGEGTAVGMISIDFDSRRRVRLNGRAEANLGVITVSARQVYANCPKYIQARRWESREGPGRSRNGARRTRRPSEEQRRLISGADTFFIASFHPEGGADASHRGGMPGFVRFVDEGTLEFPDYAGNAMFNTLGNPYSVS